MPRTGKSTREGGELADGVWAEASAGTTLNRLSLQVLPSVSWHGNATRPGRTRLTYYSGVAAASFKPRH
jgi:hypothetical protein